MPFRQQQQQRFVSIPSTESEIRTASDVRVRMRVYACFTFDEFLPVYGLRALEMDDHDRDRGPHLLRSNRTYGHIS